MSVNGIGNALGTVRLPQAEPRPRVEQEQAAQTPTPASAPGLARLREPLATPQAAGALPAEAPAGTDPELWAVLSAEERAFFARAGSMGPLTYGHVLRSGGEANAIIRGGRLDVRA